MEGRREGGRGRERVEGRKEGGGGRGREGEGRREGERERGREKERDGGSTLLHIGSTLSVPK